MSDSNSYYPQRLFSFVILPIVLCALLLLACGVPVDEHESVVAARDAIITERDETIVLLNATVSGHEQTIGLLNATVSGHEQAIGLLNATVSQSEQAIGKRDAIISDMDADIARLDSTIYQHEQTIGERNTVISVLDANIADLEATAKQKDATIAEKDALISDMDADIARLDSTISQHEQTIGERNTVISVLDANIADLEATAKQKDATIAEKDVHISTLDANLADLEATAKQQNETIAQQLTRITTISSQLNVQEGIPDSVGEIENFIKLIDERDDVHAEARYYNFEALGLGQISTYEYHRELARINSADRLDNGLLNLAQLKLGRLMAIQGPDNQEMSSWVGSFTNLTLDDVRQDREAVEDGFDKLAEIKSVAIEEQNRATWAYYRGDISEAELIAVEDEQLEIWDQAEAERRYIMLLVGFVEGLSS